MINQIKLHYSIHRQLLNKDNPTKAAYGWESTETTGQELFRLVTQEGRPFTSVFKDNHRKDPNWLKTSVIGFDFDGVEKNQLSYQQIIEDEFVKNNALFVYPSPSWSEDKQKYRVVFATQEPIIDPDKFKALVIGLMKTMKGVDEQCKDLARFFWGCNIPKAVQPLYLDNLLDEIMITNISKKEVESVDAQQVTLKDEKYASFFTGQMFEGTGRNAIVYELAKDLAKSPMTLGSASGITVALNLIQKEPLNQKELTLAFTNGWNKVRKDSIDDIEVTFEDAFTSRQEQLEPMEILVEGLMHKTGLAMIAGSPGVGKSLLAMNLGLAIASDKEKFLHYPIKKHGKVLWIDYEMTKQEFVGRLQKIPVVPPKDMFKYFLDAPTITDQKFLEKLSTIISDEKPVLLIIDNITTSHGGDENAAKDVRNILRPLQLLAKEHDINIMLVHHFRKHVRFETLNLDMIVGSGAFARLLHTALLMHESSKDPAIRILKAAKLRNWPHSWKEPYGVKLKDDLTFEYLGEVDEMEHLPQAFMETKSNIDWNKFIGLAEEVSREDLLNRVRATGINASPATLARWLKKAVGSEEIQQIRHGYYQRGTLEDLKASLAKVIGQDKKVQDAEDTDATIIS